MSYTIEKIEADKARDSISNYQYALVYRMSEIVFCKASDWENPKWEECLEARFFDKDKELHIYEEDGEWHAVKATGTFDSDCLMKKYELRKYYFGSNKYLSVCEHLDYDEDGQAYVAFTRLTGIE